MAESNQTATADTSTDEQTLKQTSPLNLTNYDGADHRGIARVTIDTNTLPDTLGDEIVDDLNWAINAINAVIHYPNLVLTVRTPWKDLVLAHDPHESHERAGHIRAATFTRSDRGEMTFTTQNETDAGLLTVFDAINVVYDFIVPNAFGRNKSYSMLLSDIDYINAWSDSAEHPVFNINEHTIYWGQNQITKRSFRLPNEERDGHCAFPDCTYLNSDADHPTHERAEREFREHKETFLIDG